MKKEMKIDLMPFRRIIVIVLVLFIITGISIKLLGGTIHISPTNSLKNDVFLTFKTDTSDLKLDDTVTFVYMSKSKYNQIEGKSLLIKHIKCVEGQILSVRSRDYFCDENYLGTILQYDGNNVRVNGFKYDGVIPKDKFFVMGDDKKSFDSRFYGFIDARDIVGKSYAIF